MRIFNISLKQAVGPSYLKAATFTPVPKTIAICSLSDYRLVVLILVVMNIFERLIFHHLKFCLLPNFDQHQFAHRAHRPMRDATTLP